MEKDFYYYDERGIRAFVFYSNATGAWGVEIYRKKTKEERQGFGDWKMIREGQIETYYTRKEAELKALEMAERIDKEVNNHMLV